MRGQALVAVSVLSAALMAAQPASAQNYGNGYNTYQDAHVAQAQDCQQVKNGRTAGGAIIGGILGAVIGSQAGSRGHRSDGGLVGAAAGALAGGAIGNSTANQYCANQRVEGNYDPYYGQRQDGRGYADNGRDDRGYRGDDGRQYSDRGYDDGRRYDDGYSRDAYNDDRSPNGNCRMGTVIQSDRYDRDVRQRVWMCRGRDGQWHPDRG